MPAELITPASAPRPAPFVTRAVIATGTYATPHGGGLKDDGWVTLGVKEVLAEGSRSSTGEMIEMLPDGRGAGQLQRAVVADDNRGLDVREGTAEGRDAHGQGRPRRVMDCRRDPDLRQLRYFVAVAEELNFTRAAERLHMAQRGSGYTATVVAHCRQAGFEPKTVPDPYPDLGLEALRERLGVVVYVRTWIAAPT